MYEEVSRRINHMAPVCHVAETALLQVLFRGFLLPCLAQQMRLVPAVMSSAVIFAALHGISQDFVPLSLLGLLFGAPVCRLRQPHRTYSAALLVEPEGIRKTSWLGACIEACRMYNSIACRTSVGELTCPAEHRLSTSSIGTSKCKFAKSIISWATAQS